MHEKHVEYRDISIENSCLNRLKRIFGLRATQAIVLPTCLIVCRLVLAMNVAEILLMDVRYISE